MNGIHVKKHWISYQLARIQCSIAKFQQFLNPDIQYFIAEIKYL